MAMISSSSSNNNGQFGDTSLTKVFVGGLAWETSKEELRQHFEKFGVILEAVIISDKLTGRSKGYGFVTFMEAEAAKKACEEQQGGLIINGRKANCNLASIGARRPRSSSTTPTANSSSPQPKETGSNNGGAIMNNGSSITAANNHNQWYYPVSFGTPNNANASPLFHLPHHHHHHHHHALPYYGYTPTYIATDMNNYHYNYNQKMRHGGAYMSSGHHVYPRHTMVGANTVMPMYPLYYQHHPTETMGVPTHYFHPTVVMPMGQYGAMTAGMVSKPVSITPHTGTVGGVECFKAVV